MGKLVRDLIPDIIRKDGFTPILRQLNNEEYLTELTTKLREECDEYATEHNPEELADVLEVLYALAKLHGLDAEKLEALRAQKAKARGGFEERIYWEGNEARG